VCHDRGREARGDGCVRPACAAALNARYSVRAGGATAVQSCGRRRPHTASSAVETESHDDCIYDYLVVNGKKYCGTSGPDGVASDGTIIWTAKSDSWCANEGSCEGWQLCWECPPCTESARQVLFAPYVAPAAHATAAAFDECCFD